MRVLLASAALLGLALSAPAFAQATNDMAPAPAATPAPAKPMHPLATAHALPADGSPASFLAMAQTAAQQHRAMLGQDALEHAETRMLDRSTTPSAADRPDTAPMVAQIGQARDALGRHDWQQAEQLISDLMKQPMASNTDTGMAKMPPATTNMNSTSTTTTMPAAAPAMDTTGSVGSLNAGSAPPVGPGIPGGTDAVGNGVAISGSAPPVGPGATGGTMTMPAGSAPSQP